METTKLNPISKEEKEILFSFIGKAVWENVSFPSNSAGFQNITVQDIVNKNEQQLTSYGKFIEKSFANTGSQFDDDDVKDKKRWGSITASEFITFLLLVKKNKKYEAQERERLNKINDIKVKLANMKTPDEVKKELEEQLLSLNTFA